MNIDQNEVTKFAELADKWWDKEGDFKPLHKINPLRANYINDIIHVENKEYLNDNMLLSKYNHDVIVEFLSEISDSNKISHDEISPSQQFVEQLMSL